MAKESTSTKQKALNMKESGKTDSDMAMENFVTNKDLSTKDNGSVV